MLLLLWLIERHLDSCTAGGAKHVQARHSRSSVVMVEFSTKIIQSFSRMEAACMELARFNALLSTSKTILQSETAYGARDSSMGGVKAEAVSILNSMAFHAPNICLFAGRGKHVRLKLFKKVWAETFSVRDHRGRAEALQALGSASTAVLESSK